MRSPRRADVSMAMTDVQLEGVATRNGHAAHVERVRLMLVARALEHRAIAFGTRPRAAISPAARDPGPEAFGVGSASALQVGDRLFAPDRYLSAHLVRGLDPEDFVARRLGGRRRRGDGGEPGSAGWVSSGTELIDLAAGAALALRLRDGADLVSMALVPGEAYASGQCDRALRAAAARGLALVLMVEAPAGLQARDSALEVADSADVDAVFNRAVAAVASARAGFGPQTVICRRGSV
jgi:TPP-dependent pyruvate/acetoin dehydrogenase alpha subunit